MDDKFYSSFTVEVTSVPSTQVGKVMDAACGARHGTREFARAGRRRGWMLPVRSSRSRAGAKLSGEEFQLRVEEVARAK